MAMKCTVRCFGGGLLLQCTTRRRNMNQEVQFESLLNAMRTHRDVSWHRTHRGRMRKPVFLATVPLSVMFFTILFLEKVEKEFLEITMADFLGIKLQTLITVFHHKMQSVQFRSGTPVVKGLEDRPCD